tara:strand:- start:277 stop:438 length:162 start_codon:yes stop_codon:yes gene_type:complete
MKITLTETKKEAQKILDRENLCEDTIWEYVKDNYNSFGENEMNKLADEIHKLL